MVRWLFSRVSLAVIECLELTLNVPDRPARHSSALDRSYGRPLARGFLDFLWPAFQKDGSNIHPGIVLP